MSVYSRRQALKLCLDAAIIVIIKVRNQLCLEVLHGFKLLQIQKLSFENAKEIGSIPNCV